MPDVPLSEATLPQLVEELARRMNDNGGREEAPEVWCDDCVHFKLAGALSSKRKDYNPCAKRHVMAFWVPRPHESPETFGYYREVCADRSIPEPALPLPPREAPPPREAALEAWERPDFRMDPPPRGGRPAPVDPEDCPG